MLATTSTMLAVMQYDTIDIAAVVAEAIAPVVITRLAGDLSPVWRSVGRLER